MKTQTLKMTVIAVALASAVGGAYSIGHSQAATDPQPAVQTAPAAAPAAALPATPLPDLGAIVERNGPAVVNISISGSRQVNASLGDPGDPFYEFFRRFRGAVPHGGEAPVRGQGSGFIITADGTILTNAHVVEDADEVTVKLTDKREFRAKVMGLDKTSDVAVLKIEATGLPTVRIGNTANTRVGEWVLAIGSPFGFENSASAGIVSAKSRSLPDGSYVPFLQTDVAVNPGNSGGPLFNLAGEVIGINSQIYSRSGGYQGLSFAIPIEVAMNVERQIVTKGKVQRGRLGISIQEVNQSLADAFGLKKPGGALVNSVEKSSPAAAAGLEPGDVILAANGREITNTGDLPVMIAGMSADETVKLQVWRAGSTREVTVKVGSFSEPAQATSGNEGHEKGRLGVAVRPLSPEEQRQAEVTGGLLVQEAQGAAARAGIRSGDIIVSVNGETIRNVDQLKKLISKAGKRVAILVERGDSRIFVPVELG